MDIKLLEDSAEKYFLRIHKREQRYVPQYVVTPKLIPNRKASIIHVASKKIYQFTRNDTGRVFYGNRIDITLGDIKISGFWTFGSVIKRIWAVDKHEVIPVPKWVLMKASMVAYDRLSKLLDLDDK